jgi:hypothetical protein
MTKPVKYSMRSLFKLLLFIALPALSGSNLFAQAAGNMPEGTVSYVTSQHVYVRFASTKGMTTGDTLFIRQQGKLAPALKIVTLSSLSCVCESLNSIMPAAGTKIFPSSHRKPAEIIPPQTVEKQEKKIQPEKTTLPKDTERSVNPVQQISGRISASALGTSVSSDYSLRMQYTLSLNAKHIGGTGLSAESYVVFFHKNNEWDKVKKDIFNGLKIYNLSLSYEIGKHAVVTAGRKINSRFSNIGAVDGLQAEYHLKSFTAGLIGGFRPDYSNYGFNPDLLQYGGFINHEFKGTHGIIQNTLAFIEQNNAGNTDRRFAYFQHSNELVKNLHLFGSAEVDLYGMKLQPEDSSYSPLNELRLSNLYVSLRYRIRQKLMFSVSYSARQNIVYYETYKSYLDRLLESETQQGYLFHMNYHPADRIFIGLTAGYRIRKGDSRDSRNVNGYASYRIPGINLNTTINGTYVEAPYVTGASIGGGFSKEIARGKLEAGVNYHYQDFTYGSTDISSPQHNAEVNLNWRIGGKFYLSAYYEGIFEKTNDPCHRMYVQLSKRF